MTTRIDTRGPSLSRLRERLRTGQHAPPAEPVVDPDWEQCEIAPQYVSGSINLQYRFRATAQRPNGVRYTAAVSPPFLTSPPPLLPTDAARAALTALHDQLLRDGWQPAADRQSTHWYEQTLRRPFVSARSRRYAARSTRVEPR